LKLVTTILLGTCLLSGCKREDRNFHISAPAANSIEAISLSPIHPGGGAKNEPVNNDYEENGYALSEGKTLYSEMNCVGCHSHGGGGMGVPLMDSTWIYGSRPEQIFATIVEGRPNGMPSFRGKLTNNQVWQLVAYVRSMSGLTSKDAAPGRDDHMQIGPPENSRSKLEPKQSVVPKTR
jgi:cytochrome c oxidase cbb3-type subunit 3